MVTTTIGKLDNPKPSDKGYFTASNNTTLRFRYWLPSNTTGQVKPLSCVLIVHGFGEHGMNYAQLVKGLLACGIAVISYDQRGHGRSDGQRGHINSWYEYRNDLHSMLKHIHAIDALATVPLFMYAHSMGALVGLDYIAHHPLDFKGSIISAPPLKSGHSVNVFLVSVAKIMSSIAPKLSLPLQLANSALSRDPEVVSHYVHDPYRHNQASARWGTEMLSTIKWVNSHARQIISPILLLHGESDSISQAQGTQTFFTQVTSGDKTIRIYPNGLHQSHNDSNATEVIADIIKWINLRL